MKQFSSAKPEGATPRVSPLEGIKFELDGTEFRCQGRVKVLDQSELALLAAQGGDMRTAQAQAASAAYLQVAMGLPEYYRFKAHVDEYDTDDETVLEIMSYITSVVQERLETMTGRPTMPPSSSSPGQPVTADRISLLRSLGGQVEVEGEPMAVPAKQEVTGVTQIRRRIEAKPKGKAPARPRTGGGKTARTA